MRSQILCQVTFDFTVLCTTHCFKTALRWSTGK